MNVTGADGLLLSLNKDKKNFIKKSEFTINRLNYGWNRPFLNLCHLLCGMPHGGCRGLGRRGNAFLSAGFGSSSPDRAGRAPAGGGGGRPTGPATGFVQRLHPNCPGLSIKCGENTPQLLAKFYRKRVAVLGRRDAQVALRSCCSTNKTSSTHILSNCFL